MDKCLAVQHIWEGEEISGVDEDVLINKLIGGVKGKVFSGAHVHGRR